MPRRKGRAPTFSGDELSRLMALAASPPAGRSLEERVAETFTALAPLVQHDTSFVHWSPQGWLGGEPRILLTTIPEDRARAYLAHYHRVDPMAPSIPLKLGRTVCLSDFVPESKLDALEYSELLRPTSIRHVAGLSVQVPGAGHLVISLHRGKGVHDFTAKERVTLELLAGTFARLVAGEAAKDDPLHRFRLTDRQRRLVELTARGLGDREIARELGIGAGTVRTHLRRLFPRLGVRNRTELVALLHGRG